MRPSSCLLLSVLVCAHCVAVPLAFEQRSSRYFLAHGANGMVELGPDRVTLSGVTLRFSGAATAAHLEGVGPSAPATYLRAGFSRTFKQFPKVAIRGLYPGVDAIFYSNGEDLEYDLEIARGVPVERIVISLDGGGARIDEQGDLIIGNSSGEVRQMKPRVFQHGREIPANYVLLAANQVGLRLGKHDRRSPLTVDPVVSQVKYFGDSGSNTTAAIVTDAQGNLYVAGQSNSVDFPTSPNGYEPAGPSPLRVLSNAGTSIGSLRAGTAVSVGLVAGTPDGTILYAATTQGILLSGDGGNTWRQTAPLPIAGVPFQYVTVNAIALEPLDPATILVATNQGLFGTDSGGEFWGQRTTGLPVSASGYVSASWVSYSPSNPLIAFAVTSNPSYLFASRDAGNTWTALNPTYPGEPSPPTDPFPSMAAALSPDGSLLYAINGNGTLLRSTDGGKSWVRLAEGLYGPSSIQIDPSNPTNLYVLTQMGLEKSADGGLTFSAVKFPSRILRFAVDSSGALYVASFNQIFVSTDGGNTLAPIPNTTSSAINSLSALGSAVYAGSITPSVPFVIKLDPTGSNVLYSTFLGGSSGDGASGIAVDSKGQAVLVGYTASADFPLTVPAASAPSPNKLDGFVSRLSADGTQLISSAALGSSKTTTFQAVALDSSGAAVVTGNTVGVDFPTTENVVQPAPPSSPCPRMPSSPFVSIATGYAFVTKISPDAGSIIYSTFLTGSCGSLIQWVGIDAAGDPVVAGNTSSMDFPATAGSYQPAFPAPTTERGILIAGFVTRLSPAADKILASTFLGGGYSTLASGAAIDGAGNILITGFTQGIAPGATPGAYQSTLVDRCTPTLGIGPSPPYTGTGDAFILKLDAALSSARFLTYLGGSCNDSGSRIAVDAAGNIWVAGSTASEDFPLKEPFQGNAIPTSLYPGFVSELSADASRLLFSSFRDGAAMALGPAEVFLAGSSGSSAYVASLDPLTTPAVEIDSLAPLTGYPPFTIPPFPGSLAPGMLLQISGHNLGPAAKINGQLDSTGRLPFLLGNVSVFFDNLPAPLVSVADSGIVCFAPFEIGSSTQVTVSVNGQRSNPVRMGVVASVAQILSVVNQDGTVNSADHPAKSGSMISVFVSGLGQTNPPAADGLTNAPPLPVPLAPIFVSAAGTMITPQFFGAAPGMIAGITQVNISLPASLGAASRVALNVNAAGATVYVAQ